jgi:hypothetical protein
MQVKFACPRGNVQGGLLSKAVELFEGMVGRSERLPLEDNHGIYANILPKVRVILCAKSAPHFDTLGNMIVSCHETLIRTAFDKHFRVIMFVDSLDTSKEFDPREICNDPTSTINFRDGVQMVNFLWKLGRSIDQIPMWVMKKEELVPSDEARQRLKGLIASLGVK